MNWFKPQNLGIALAISCLPMTISAQSALYIQGDKKTPIYVKVEGNMMPRQGFNYCIIPNLEAGTAKFEILFQGNQYPPQQYNISIPEKGVRGLVLTKVDEKNFALFDIQTQGYIYNKNKTDEAFLQINPSDNSIFASNKSAQTENTERKQKDKTEKATEETSPKLTQEEQLVVEKKDVPPATNRFIENLDLSESKSRDKKKKNDNTILIEDQLFRSKDDGNVKNGNRAPQSVNDPGINNSEVEIPNSDCNTAMTESAFESYLGSFNGQSGDEDKLKYVKKTYQKRCFSTEQSGILANLMNGQSTRFELLQLLYPRVSDQSNYQRLEKLFSTGFLKKRFNDLIK